MTDEIRDAAESRANEPRFRRCPAASIGAAAGAVAGLLDSEARPKRSKRSSPSWRPSRSGYDARRRAGWRRCSPGRRSASCRGSSTWDSSFPSARPPSTTTWPGSASMCSSFFAGAYGTLRLERQASGPAAGRRHGDAADRRRLVRRADVLRGWALPRRSCSPSPRTTDRRDGDLHRAQRRPRRRARRTSARRAGAGAAVDPPAPDSRPSSTSSPPEPRLAGHRRVVLIAAAGIRGGLSRASAVGGQRKLRRRCPERPSRSLAISSRRTWSGVNRR